MRRIIFISALLLFLCVSSVGMAFDNNRRGFIIGGLGGVAVDNWSTFDEDGVKVDSGQTLFLHIDFRIGGGFKGNKLMLYGWVAGNFSSGPTSSTIAGVGASYYFKPIGPSFYVNAGFGKLTWLYGSWFTQETYEGLGIMGGIGYEFAQHWSVECGARWAVTAILGGNPSNRVDSLAISLSIIGIAY